MAVASFFIYNTYEVNHMNIPQNVNFILQTLEHAGFEAFIVGGCVRDIIRGVVPKDWDIATSAAPAQAKLLFARTIDTGIKHGTITVLIDKQHYEVTTYRIDGEYLDSRRPETVQFTRNIEDDLARRDFTMNAIAYHPSRGFVDPFGGQEDIKHGIIRCVGEPMHRFKEDALRMLRAIRFSGTTGFKICSKTLDAITELSQNLQNISPERIREELGKLVTSPNPKATELLHTTGLLPYILKFHAIQNPCHSGLNPEFSCSGLQTMPITVSTNETCPMTFSLKAAGQVCNDEVQCKISMSLICTWLTCCPPHEQMRMALFLHWAGKNCENILRNLRFDNNSIKEISLYIKMLYAPLPQNRYEIKKLLRLIPQELFENLLLLKSIVTGQTFESLRLQVADIIKKGECFTLRDLAVNGKTLTQIGIPHGKIMGDILENLLDIVMQNPEMNTAEALMRYAI